LSQDNNVLRADRLDTATLSDALDRLGIVGQCYQIKGRDDDFKFVGRAYTMRCGPASTPPGTVGDYIDEVPLGQVVVIDNGGRTDATIWGDILTEIAHRRGLPSVPTPVRQSPPEVYP
jgi:regulator of RNase E activity RraA